MKFTSVILLLVLTPLAQANTSKYTSIETKRCKTISQESPDEPGDSFEAICKGLAGIQVNAVSGDARSWLVFTKANVASSTYEVMMERAGGFFPNLAANKIEWRFDDKKELKAIIFRVSAQDVDNYEISHNSLFVVRPAGEKVCLLGIAKSNGDARKIADTATGCQ